MKTIPEKTWAVYGNLITKRLTKTIQARIFIWKTWRQIFFTKQLLYVFLALWVLLKHLSCDLGKDCFCAVLGITFSVKPRVELLLSWDRDKGTVIGPQVFARWDNEPLAASIQRACRREKGPGKKLKTFC